MKSLSNKFIYFCIFLSCIICSSNALAELSDFEGNFNSDGSYNEEDPREYDTYDTNNGATTNPNPSTLNTGTFSTSDGDSSSSNSSSNQSTGLYVTAVTGIGSSRAGTAPCRCSVNARRYEAYGKYLEKCVEGFGLNPVAHFVMTKNRSFSKKKDLFAYTNLPAKSKNEAKSNTCTNEIIDEANELLEEIDEAEEVLDAEGNMDEESSETDEGTEVTVQSGDQTTSSETDPYEYSNDELCIAHAPGIRGRLNFSGEACYCVDNGNSDDIWGWDHTNQISCRFTHLNNSESDEADNCDYTHADEANGWGWDPVLKVSCAPLR